MTIQPSGGLITPDVRAAITGTATPGATVIATAIGQTFQARVDEDGNFTLVFDALQVGTTSFSITAKAALKYPADPVPYKVTRRQLTLDESKASATRVESGHAVASSHASLVSGVVTIRDIVGDRATACFVDTPPRAAGALCDAVILDASVSGALTNIAAGSVVQFYGVPRLRNANDGTQTPGVGVVILDVLPG